MYRSFIASLFIASIALLMQACGNPPQAQPSCNFVQNNDAQRVSWGQNLPVVLYVDRSVPGSMYPVIQAAAKEWNDSLGKEVLKIAGWSSQSGAPAQDGVNIIYWLNTWDSNRAFEQARTTVYWTDTRFYEADVVVNAQDFNLSWSSTAQAGTVDAQSLLVHEFGHVLGLVHVVDSSSVMVKSLPADFLRREPQKLDINSAHCEY